MDRDVENLDYTTMYVVCRSVNSNEPEVLNNIEQYQSNVSISLFFSSMFLVDVRRIYQIDLVLYGYVDEKGKESNEDKTKATYMCAFNLNCVPSIYLPSLPSNRPSGR